MPLKIGPIYGQTSQQYEFRLGATPETKHQNQSTKNLFFFFSGVQAVKQYDNASNTLKILSMIGHEISPPLK